MGYIFDALNKQRDGQADAPAPEPTAAPTEAPGATPEQPDPTAGLADTLEGPLRLADIELRFDPSDQETAVARVDAHAAAVTWSDEADASESTDIDHDESTLALAAVSDRAAGRGGWWRRLLGRSPRGSFDDRLVTKTSPASSVAEEYRSIRTSILARHDNARNLVHTITSATPQEGKTITCVNLGMSFAELRNRETIVVECDLRLPTFSKLLPCDADKPGLIEYLRGEVNLGEVIQRIEGSRLHIIPAGGRVSDEAVQLLSSPRMSRLIESLRAKYDHVLIDTPPVLQLADAGILGSQSEEVLLVARMRRTPRTLVEQAVNTLTTYNASVSGIIATDNPRSRGRGYGYKYGYRYGYGYGYGYTSEPHGKPRKHRSAA